MDGRQVWRGYELAGPAIQGTRLITFWSGSSHGPHSNGSYYMLDSSYGLIHIVSAVGPGFFGDLHEFEVTPQGTALLTIYNDKLVDCSSVGIDGECWIDDCLFQEVDIETGNLIFQWRASDHVPLTDSYKTIGGDGDGKTPKTAYDFFHINSIEKDEAGNYIISSRHMHTIYCIGPAGDILWTIGGKHSSFTDLSDGFASKFAWQHHARLHGNNTISLFDNGGNNVFHKFSHFSRGMMIQVDTDARTVSLVHEYIHPSKLLAISQGSMQVMNDGNVLVGWGNTPAFTELRADGEVLCDMHFGPSLVFEILDFGWVKSYRAFKSKWVGRPKTKPDIKVLNGRVFVSWNGATEVKSWMLQGAESETAGDEDFIDLEELEKTGFETAFEQLEMSDAFVRVVALDALGKVLSYSAVIDAKSSPPQSWWFSFLEFLVFVLSFAGAGMLVWKYKASLSTQARKIIALLRRKEPEQEYVSVDLEASDKRSFLSSQFSRIMNLVQRQKSPQQYELVRPGEIEDDPPRYRESVW